MLIIVWQAPASLSASVAVYIDTRFFACLVYAAYMQKRLLSAAAETVLCATATDPNMLMHSPGSNLSEQQLCQCAGSPAGAPECLDIVGMRSLPPLACLQLSALLLGSTTSSPLLSCSRPARAACNKPHILPST